MGIAALILSGAMILVSLCYMAMVLVFVYGWNRLKYCAINQLEVSASVDSLPAFSIVVAARNEERHIRDLLEAVVAQDYPVNKFELIIVDDASEDATAVLVEAFIKEQGKGEIKLIRVDDERGGGKKEALTQGIRRAWHELIVTTDADCVMGPHWLASIASCYRARPCKMLIGPVAFHREKNTFQKLQSLEFMSLIGSTAACTGLHKPIMCNGANLMYEKKLFEDLQGFEGVDHRASGDDLFLLQKIKKQYPSEIGFLLAKEGIVYTEAKKTWQELYLQRKRWASKATSYKDPDAVTISWLVFLTHFFLLLALVFSFLSPVFFYTFAGIFLLKAFVEYYFLSGVARFFNRRDILRYFIPESILYAFYILTIALTAPFGSYTWKGRRVK